MVEYLLIFYITQQRLGARVGISRIAQGEKRMKDWIEKRKYSGLPNGFLNAVRLRTLSFVSPEMVKSTSLKYPAHQQGLYAK